MSSHNNRKRHHSSRSQNNKPNQNQHNPPRKHPNTGGPRSNSNPKRNNYGQANKPRYPHDRPPYQAPPPNYPPHQNPPPYPQHQMAPYPGVFPPQFQNMSFPPYPGVVMPYYQRPMFSRPTPAWPTAPPPQSPRPESSPQESPHIAPVQEAPRVGWGQGIAKKALKAESQDTPPRQQEPRQEDRLPDPVNTIPFDQPSLPPQSLMLMIIEDVDTKILSRENQINRFADLKDLNYVPDTSLLPSSISVINPNPLINAVTSHSMVKGLIARKYHFHPMKRQSNHVTTLTRPPFPRNRNTSGGILEATGVDPAFEMFLGSICKEAKQNHVSVELALKSSILQRKCLSHRVRRHRREVYRANHSYWWRDLSSRGEVLFTPLPEFPEKDPWALKIMNEEGKKHHHSHLNGGSITGREDKEQLTAVVDGE
ncbi:hypothetical protein GEMRC1_003936 [Eukaryota sp. GEM-RC1]